MNEREGKTQPGGVHSGGSRRSLLKKGLLGGAILLVGGGASLWFRATRVSYTPGRPLRCLSETEYAIFAAAAARICPGNTPQNAAAGWPSIAAIGCADQVDALMADLHPRAAHDFRRLLRVFESGVTGLLSIGLPNTFTASAVADQDRRLEAWRHSRVALFRSGYQAIKRLAHATYYASPETYGRIGYPGPPVVPS